MGQYHLIVNETRGEYLDPHTFDDGWKLVELSSGETMLALAILLAADNGKGGGDFRYSEIAGSWAGCKITIAGDYGEPRDDGRNLHETARQDYTNVSAAVLEAVQKEVSR